MHPSLRLAGLLNPLDAPHHMRADDLCPFREGVVLDRTIKKGAGSFVDIGKRKVWAVKLVARDGGGICAWCVRLDGGEQVWQRLSWWKSRGCLVRCCALQKASACQQVHSFVMLRFHCALSRLHLRPF